MRKSSNAAAVFRFAVPRHVLPALLFMLWVMCGCAAVRPLSRALPPLKDPQQFLRSMLQDYVAIKHFSAMCRMKITSPRGSVSVKGIVAGLLPSSLRVEMFAFLNQLAFVFSTDGAAMSFYLPSRNTFYTGKAADGHLAFLYGADIRLHEAIALFLGYPSSIVLSDTGPATWQYDNDRYLFKLPSAGGRRQQIWVDFELNKITQYRLCDAAGNTVYDFSFSDFRPAGTHMVPYAINLYFHQSQTRINVTYSEMDTELLPDSGLFTLAPPAHAERLPLEELSRSILLQPE
jgi:outer membrane lipoprotein-sorting protein